MIQANVSKKKQNKTDIEDILHARVDMNFIFELSTRR